jgi:hypothetical protein
MSSSRPSNRSGRHSTQRDGATPDTGRGGVDEDRQVPDVDQDPPLEFPTSQQRPTIRKGDRS